MMPMPTPLFATLITMLLDAPMPRYYALCHDAMMPAPC